MRRIRPDEGDALRSIRLAALVDTPSAFGSTHAAEVDLPPVHWSARAAASADGTGSATFVAVDGGTFVGMVAAYRPDSATNGIELVSMWVSPTARRRGTAARLVDSVVDWARGAGATNVDLWVAQGNDAAVRLYEVRGFRSTGEYEPLPSDPGRHRMRMRYTLVSPTSP